MTMRLVVGRGIGRILSGALIGLFFVGLSACDRSPDPLTPEWQEHPEPAPPQRQEQAPVEPAPREQAPAPGEQEPAPQQVPMPPTVPQE